ncbi:MAG: nucleoside-diphosphate sugar epimerase/dehydratase [Oscillospiraceae bacterium]|nr:nucleoside-diphosphate sugar epimerase/dehydratase [Oscillospiraceae bacterium]
MKKLTGDYSKEKLVRVLCLVTADAVIVNLAAVVTLLIRFSIDGMTVWNSAFEWYLKLYLGYAVINTVVTIVMFALFNLYNSLWEFAGYNELVRIGCASVASALVNFVLMMVIEDSRMPLSFPIVYSMLLAAGTGTLRLIYRALRRKRADRSTAEKKRTMLIGGGQAGAMVLREFRYSAHSENKVVCVIDDDRSKWGNFIQGVKIVGGKESIVSAAEKYNVEEIILAIPSASRRQKLDILEICHATGCKLRTLPGLYQLANGEVSIQKIREVDIEDLLGRDIVKIDLNEVAGYIKDKVVLVTGGGGSIGSELCRQAATQKPKTLIIFDIYENNAYELQMELRRQHPELDLVVLIGSVRDKDRVDYVFDKYRPDIVCHAAAHKHVPLMEDSPLEAIKNNVFGTYNVAEAADRYGARRMILVSTDKAVNPTNVMGASKRICEMVVQMWNGRSKTEYVAVRFGNVLGSAGSVIPLFRRQIKEGGPVTVTDKNVIRYFMTIPEAVQLIFQAGAYAKGGEIFVLDMGEPVRIDDLARNMIRLSGLEPDLDIPIVYTGLRPGEKLYEELLLSGEGMQKTANDLIYIGGEAPFDEALLSEKLTELSELHEGEEMLLRTKISELVPTYHMTENDAKRMPQVSVEA